ncbi:hypothetical protein PGC08_05750 [Brevibacterium sp. BDJS002]|uniref:hypothetical protein n=1 Tax=Brevibacterium sp. BDJS002 TaxID=3020906 RepID=UPI002306EC4F|nr:hypothetical protein [Brevibacterium sp. BDJS002]WCE41186.1 hypothetical protein PGC08_05750 [Brevibacterium sp. BDJS002]
MIDTEFEDLVAARAHALNVLVTFARNISNADDFGDMLGALRLTELAAQQARSAIIREARAAGDSWENIADALGTSTQAARSGFELPNHQQPQ